MERTMDLIWQFMSNNYTDNKKDNDNVKVKDQGPDTITTKNINNSNNNNEYNNA